MILQDINYASAVNASRNANINFKNRDYNFDDLSRGAIVETEHGRNRSVDGISLDVAKGDSSVYPRIALAHLEERGDYYDGLEVIEKAPAGYWRGKTIKDVIGRSNMTIVLLIVITIIAITSLYLSDFKKTQVASAVIAGLTLIQLISMYYNKEY
jgi:hypothetical protein